MTAKFSIEPMKITRCLLELQQADGTTIQFEADPGYLAESLIQMAIEPPSYHLGDLGSENWANLEPKIYVDVMLHFRFPGAVWSMYAKQKRRELPEAARMLPGGEP